MADFYAKYPITGGSGGGVPTYPNFASLPATASDGALAVTLDTEDLYIFNAMTMMWTVLANGGGGSGVTTVGTIDSNPASADGASISGTAIYMQSASDTVPGLVNLTTQTFAGDKTIDGNITADNFSGSSSGTNTGNVSLTAVGSSPNVNAATLTGQALNLELFDDTNPGVVPASGGGMSTFLRADGTWDTPPGVAYTFNDTDSIDLTETGGAVSADLNLSSAAAGASNINALNNIETDGLHTQVPIATGSVAGVVSTTTQTLAGDKTFTGSISSANLSGTNTGDVTLAAVGSSPNGNAATLTGQALNLELFDSTNPGVVPASGGSSTDYLSADGTWSTPAGGGGSSYSSSFQVENLTLVASVATNALTIAVKTLAGTDPAPGDEVKISFRDTTITTGGYTTVSLDAALSIIIPQGATLGRSIVSRNWPLIIYAINNAGAIELAVSTTGGNSADVTNTTTISSGATAAATIYSTAGRTGVAIVPIGVAIVNLANNSNYTAVPTNLSLTAGQPPSDVLSERLNGIFLGSVGPVVTGSVAVGLLAITNGTNATALGNQTNAVGASSVAIGLTATTNTASSVAIGSSAVVGASGTNGVAIGASAGANAATTVAIGAGAIASTTGANSIAIGSGTSTSSTFAIGLGANAFVSTSSSGSIAIGAGAQVSTSTANSILLTPGESTTRTTAISAANQFALGDTRTNSFINDMVLGRGAVAIAGNGSALTMRLTPTSGANSIGSDFTIQAGNGTGTGGSGNIIFQTAPVAGSSSTANNLVTTMNIAPSGAVTIGPAATTPTHFLNTNSTTGSGIGTLTNVPGAAGNPAGYIQITINGTISYIPYFQ